MTEVYPPFTKDYRFTGPTTAISCDVEYDKEEGEWVATASTGSFKATSRLGADNAALACFAAWMGGERAWFETQEEPT